jgi:ABC-type transporter Mla subunit MlaD
MATRATYVKIGMFVTLAFCAILAVGVLIGLQRIHRRTVPVYTYFDEAVTGLEVGSPVRMRGVPIGQVGNITFAPDHRMVEVRGDIDVDAMVRLGFPAPQDDKIQPPSNVRTQLASQGLAGVRFIAVDYFDEKTNPPPVLSFSPPENYIPAAGSVQHTLEESATSALNGVASLVETLQRGRLAERVVQTTTDADQSLMQLQQFLRSLNRQDLPQHATDTLEGIRQAAGRVNKVLERFDGDSGLVATTQRSVGAFGDASRQAGDSARDLSETLEEIRSAASAMRILADRLERDPDMLLKGRAKGNAP